MWIAKSAQSAADGATVVALLPSRTDTKWWQNHVEPIRLGYRSGGGELLRGRLKFSGAKNGAPFPSAIVVFAPERQPDLMSIRGSGADWARWIALFWAEVG